MLTPSSISSLQPLTTTEWKTISVNELENHIQTYSHHQFTGRLDLNVENVPDQERSLYFSLGSLIWATGRLHPLRRWYRQLSRYCPQLLVGQASHLSHCPDYDLLAQFLRQGKIKKYEMEAVIEGQILEILFDIIQWGEKLALRFGGQLTYRTITVDTIDSKLYGMSTERALQDSQRLWEAWQRAGLEQYSPNLAPTISNHEKLQKQTSETVYRNLAIHVDGNQTLRDLAVKMNRNLLLLTRPIKPYIYQGLITLKKTEDIQGSIHTVADNKNCFNQERKIAESADISIINKSIIQPSKYPISSLTPLPFQANNSLVACIDDNRNDGLAMSKILSEAGYRCLNIQDSVQALPKLIENKPDLIFLDLVMPIANGYEICSQIRRVSMFKDTPVIILTSNDGIVDRVRAKMVGASGFLAKPIDSEKVLDMLRIHLHKLMPIRTQKFQMADS